MDLEEVNHSLLSENEKLRRENKELKATLAIVRENAELRATMRRGRDDTSGATGTRCSYVLPLDGGRDATAQWQDPLDEGQFRKHLQRATSKQTHRTSSRVNLDSTHAEPSGEAEPVPSPQAHMTEKVEDPGRLVGEIAFQLDRRILYHVFQGQTRLYGFTVLNIPDKIIQVSTHPLTGRVDEGYHCHLSQRYADLMVALAQLGYRRILHPGFSEFLVNTYGILKRRPDSHSVQETSYSDLNCLRRLIISTAPAKLLKDVLLLLSCLDYMARKDGKSLLLW